jgi:predicted  nucleic acid-binding Zn-ribbon protein
MHALDQRFRRVERRLEDAEDGIAAALSADRVDDLSHEVEQLAVTAVTHDDLLQARLEIARLAAELTRVRAELQAELDDLAAALRDVADPRVPRRAAG